MEVSSRQVEQVHCHGAGQFEENAGQEVEKVGCPSRAWQRWAACLGELRRSEATV